MTSTVAVVSDNNDCEMVMFLKDPIPQITNDCNPSFEAKNCKIPVTALTLNDNITPISNKVVVLTRCAKSAMIISIIIAPTKAADKMTIFPPKKVKICLPATNVTNATPSDAPELIPKIDESAKGLRNNVCIANPAVESAMPAVAAATADGKRNFNIMV